MHFLLFLLQRSIFPHRGSLLALALWISVAGVALGIIQLMVVLSVFSGFQYFLENSYTRITSKLVVVPTQGTKLDPKFSERLQSIKGIDEITPFALGQGMILKKGVVGGVVLEGIDLNSTRLVTSWNEVFVEGPRQDIHRKETHWMWLGVQLAKKLDVSIGERVNVLMAEGEAKRIIPFTISGITRFGIYDHDLRYARVDLGVLNSIYQTQSLEPYYKTALSEKTVVGELAMRVLEAFDYDVNVKPWSTINRNIFLAVQHQKKLLFLVLEIIVALAAVNVVNLLLMNAQHRRRDIAILRAMGMRFRGVFGFFLAQGSIVGVVGVFVGLFGGAIVCQLVRHLQPALLSQSVYNVTKLPIRVEFMDTVLISVGALVLCVVFSVLPAARAAMERPIEALRYE